MNYLTAKEAARLKQSNQNSYNDFQSKIRYNKVISAKTVSNSINRFAKQSYFLHYLKPRNGLCIKN